MLHYVSSVGATRDRLKQPRASREEGDPDLARPPTCPFAGVNPSRAKRYPATPAKPGEFSNWSSRDLIMPNLATVASRGRQWILMPYFFGQLFTAAKSFEANPLIGSARTQCAGPTQDARCRGVQTSKGAPGKAVRIDIRRGPAGVRTRWICGPAQFSAEIRLRTAARSDKSAPLHIGGETVGRYHQQKDHSR